MPHVQGGTVTKAHTTTIELAKTVVKFLEKQGVSKISIGFIENNGKASSEWTIKIIDEQACVLISITQNSSHQEIRFYTKNPQDKQNIKLKLACFVRNNRWRLRFGSHLTEA